MSNTRKSRAAAANPAHPRSTPGRTRTPALAPTPSADQSRGRPSTSRLLAIALLAGVAVVLIAGWFVLNVLMKAPPVPPSPEGRISFVRQSPDGKRDLYVVNPDGTNQQRVTENVTIEGTTAWSPDGKQIIIQASVNGTSTIVRLDVGPDNKGANPVQLTADAKGDSVLPAWSPDGSLIAFQSKREGGDYQVFVMDRNGNGKRRLSDGQGYAGQPAWSPDGKDIVYVEGATQTNSAKDLYVVPVAGGTPKKITPGGKDLSSPQWSPDGKSILYLDNVGDRNNTINTMNPDGTSPRILVSQGGNRSATFSPDGKTVTYYSVSPDTGSDVFTVPVAGGATLNLTHLSAEDYEPAWSPDGKRLTWASRQSSEFKIVVGDPQGTNIKIISSGQGSDYQPEWGVPVK